MNELRKSHFLHFVIVGWGLSLGAILGLGTALGLGRTVQFLLSYVGA